MYVLISAQQSVLSSLGHGHVHGRRGHDDDDFQFGILGTNRFVDIGCRDPTGFCRDRVSRIRLGRYNFCWFQKYMY